MKKSERLSRDKVAELKEAYDALSDTVTHDASGKQRPIADFARDVMKGGRVELPRSDAANGKRFMQTLNDLALEYRGDKVVTENTIDSVLEDFLIHLAVAARMTKKNLRQTPGPDPKASVNNFMVSLAVLDPVVDLSARLTTQNKTPAGKEDVYYSSRSAYGLKFTTEADAEHAQTTFRNILRDGKDITVAKKTVGHRHEYWVEVPSDLALLIRDTVDDLSARRAAIEQQFIAGDVEGARENREALYAEMNDMKFATGHTAAQMAREAVSPKDRVRS